MCTILVDSYEVLERFAIISESEGDEKSFAYIKNNYGDEWLEWLKGELDGKEN